MEDKVTDRIAYDYAKDTRHDNRMSKVIILALILVVALMVAGFVIVSVHNQMAMERMAKHNTETLMQFMSQYDYETSIDVSTNDNLYDAGNVHITR